jgi:adenosylmethionine-8-amino-7-oxononanoate aminotransferase
MIAEPVSGAGGVLIPPAGYYESIQAVLDKYGIALWDDEVICGFGRLGTDFGANAMGMQPEMMVFAKALSSAYVPVSAAVVSSDFVEAVESAASDMGVFGHGYTYSGHPLGCAVAHKVLEIYERDNVFEHAAQVGDYLQERLSSFADHPLVGEVSGKGMIGALELVSSKASGKPFEGMAVGQYCAKAAESAGLIVRPLGGNRVALCPPLILQREHVDELIDKLTIAVNATLEFAKQEHLLT